VTEYKRKPNTNCIICNKPVYKRRIEIEINKRRVFAVWPVMEFLVENKNPVQCVENYF